MFLESALLALLSGELHDTARLKAAREELDVCAARIEALKAHHAQATGELEELLKRAQELANEIERGTAYVAQEATAPGPDELRERADAARDEADRLSAEIAAIDVRISDAQSAEAGGPVEHAAIGSAPNAAPAPKLKALRAQRDALAERRQSALEEAARLEREARAAEGEK